MSNAENITERLDTVIHKLSTLKELDSKFAAFGAKNHKYELKSKLTKEYIEKYQIENNIILPEEYAEFLMHVGNGGAGPCYGLFSLEENENNIKVAEVFPYDIENPFYLSGKYDEFYKQMDMCETIEEEDALNEQMDKIMDVDYENCTKGFIDLCHEGCAMYDVLIVNGKDKGSVWFFDFANDLGAIPLINPKNNESMKFLDWYELWLEEEIKFFEGNSKLKRGFGSFISYIKKS
jgi:hypothetical protein